MQVHILILTSGISAYLKDRFSDELALNSSIHPSTHLPIYSLIHPSIHPSILCVPAVGHVQQEKDHVSQGLA